MRRTSTMLLAVPVTLVVGLLLVFAWPVPGTTFSFGSIGTLADSGRMPVLLVVTTPKVIGAVLVWAATVAAAVALGRRRRRADRGGTTPRSAPLLVVAGALVVVGLVLVLVWPQSEAWFTYGSFTAFDEPGDEPSLLVLTTVEIVGALLAWAGTLVIGYVVGRRGTTPPTRALG